MKLAVIILVRETLQAKKRERVYELVPMLDTLTRKAKLVLCNSIEAKWVTNRGNNRTSVVLPRNTKF